jgi:ABC-2 type transport system ATP-binding protein
MKAIEIKNLTKQYKELKALNSINLNINQGDFFGLLGPNGAGKTTTIKVLTGLSNPTKGEIKVFNKDVIKDYKTTRSLIGLAPQEINLDKFLTVKEALLYQAGYQNINKKEAKIRTKELLKEFNLTDKEKKRTEQLSGGQKRKLMIAKSIIHNPKLLILDEPTAGADVELRHHLWQKLKELNKQGTTILLTTHYIEEAEQLCNKVAIINKGKIIALDSPKNLINNEQKSISIKLKTQPKTLPKKLKSYNIKLLDHELITSHKNPEKISKEIKNILNTHNIQIESINIKKYSLEDVFIKLTGTKL